MLDEELHKIHMKGVSPTSLLLGRKDYYSTTQVLNVVLNRRVTVHKV